MDLKKSERELRKIRCNMPSGIKRKGLTTQIKELKLKISNIEGKTGVSERKKKLIIKINEYTKLHRPLLFGMSNLFKFSEDQLNYHYLRITRKNRKDEYIYK